MSTIAIQVKEKYGVQRYYVASEHKEAICNLTKKATIDFTDMACLKALGFKFSLASPLEQIADITVKDFLMNETGG